MTQPKFAAEYSDVEDVADDIIAEFKADNGGVADVVPADRIESHLEEALVNADQFDGEDFEDVLVKVKDALLARDVMIA